jgi:UDP:flavonoid glycosyltransferase YjiC (YdhE family)
VVVSEAAEFAAGLLAEEAGIPVVRVHPGITGRGYFETLSAPHLAPVRASLGLPPDPDARRLLDIPLVTYFPAEFDLPAPGPGPGAAGHARVCRVRHPAAAGPAPREETVYVTFGTEIVGTPLFPPVLRDAVSAVTRSGRRAVVALGHADPALLADRPDVRVEPWVDPGALLPTVRAVVCHAGAGTTLGALSAATPIVAVPFMADQPLNAERVAATRTGLAVPPGDHLADRLADALREVLAEEPPGCRPMAEAIRALPSVDRALDLITAEA